MHGSLRSTFCLRFLAPPTGGGGGHGPFPQGRGWGWVALSCRSPSSAPVTRPTVLRSPSKSPSREGGGAVWGSAVGRPGARSAPRIEVLEREAAERF